MKESLTVIAEGSLSELSLSELESLIESGLDVNTKDNFGVTLLCRAAWDGRKDMVDLLLARGADISAKSNSGLSVLNAAVMGGNMEIVELFLNKGLDVNTKDNMGYTPLHRVSNSIETGRRTDQEVAQIAEALVNRGADINARTNDGATPLHTAVLSSSPGVVEVLIKHGADVNASDMNGVTPIMFALYNAKTGGLPESEKIVKILQKNGAKMPKQSTSCAFFIVISLLCLFVLSVLAKKI